MASKPIHSGARCSFELPTKLKAAIADAITIWSRIDMAVLEINWVVQSADANQKRKLAKQKTWQNFRDFKNYMQLPNVGVDFDTLWRTVDRLTDERHLIAHGSWMIVDDTRPLVVWHKYLENNDTVIGEYFDYSRFERFMSSAQKLMEMVTTIKIFTENGMANPPPQL